jgi:hypothetical protein
VLFTAGLLPWRLPWLGCLEAELSQCWYWCFF